MSGHKLKNFSRRVVDRAKRSLRIPRAKMDGPHAFVEKMLADREYYAGGKVPLPSSAIIETTTRCNLRCVMCARLEDSSPGEDLPYEAFERCMDSLIPHLERIDLNGHGETFLNKNFLEILEQAKRNGSYIAITTNATLIDEATAESLVKLGMDEMVISIDAVTPGLFEKIRKGARFDKVLENIDHINAFKSQYRRDTPHIDVQMVAMKMNIHELPALIEFAKERVKARSVSVIPLKEYPAVEGESLERYPDLAREYISEARKTAAKMGIELAVSPVLEALLVEETVAGGAKPEASAAPHEMKTYMNCDDPWKFAFVDCTGHVRPCCGTDRVMGDLGKDTFSQIWYGDEYIKFRTKLLSGEPPPECQRCVHRTKFHL
jgi:MoaA/NifB/PqqE/SkfB family radical SAM enzyme